ncbi:MAG TPA: hypothetical protein VG649_00455 [Candidatus Angelobacter sp.]|nr:hypothetical protein [Candidatus Angelobacter sp.]
MKLRDRRIGLWLNRAGEDAKVAEYASLQTAPWVDVLDSDERGLWVKTSRSDGNYAALIRWEYVALLDVQLGPLPGLALMKGKGLRE